jgi:hypothetical protein
MSATAIMQNQSPENCGLEKPVNNSDTNVYFNSADIKAMTESFIVCEGLLIECAQTGRPLPRSHSFRSIWRVLHVDGFEKSRNTFQFYTPTKFEEPLCGRCGNPRSEMCGDDFIPVQR